MVHWPVDVVLQANGRKRSLRPMTRNAVPQHENRLLPALHRIQDAHGYLKRDQLEQFSKESGVPLYRIQEVASFFPIFHLTPQPQIAIRVCDEMACHLTGAAQTLDQLRAYAGEGLTVERVSCLGRCDRPPAVLIAVGSGSATGEGTAHREFFYLGRHTDDLKRILRSFIHSGPSLEPVDTDAGRDRYPSPDWLIDPYKGRDGEYEAVRQVVSARDRLLRSAAETLKRELNLPQDTAGLADFIRGLQNEHSDPNAASPDWVEAVFKELNDATLRGMGGASIPATQKWQDVRTSVAAARRRQTDQRAFIVVNADESEPGTFKDRELLLHFPHLVVEGVIVAALVTDATEGFIYIRHEYAEQIAACKAEICRAEAKGVCGTDAPVLGRPLPISVFVSPGGYICGEQSALVEAMSDRRGEPRNLPPKLETNGLDDLPTLVSNVETFAWVPYILMNGGNGYASLGANGCKGRRFFSVSGDVQRPGVYEVPMGLTLRDLIFSERYCQGVVEGRELKAIAPSGPSGGFLPARLVAGAGLPRNHTANPQWQALAARRGFDPLAQELDILDLELEVNLFRALSPTQALGAGIIVYAQGRDMADQAVNALEFFRNESCGKCVPCRVGSQKLANLGCNLLEGQIDAQNWNKILDVVNDLGEVMILSSICGLGRSIPNPLRTLVEYFGGDLDAHLKQSRQSESGL